MTGRVYYITTLSAWQRRGSRFANSHFIVLETAAVGNERDEASASGAASCAPTNAGEQDLLPRELEDTQAWLPPQIARRFGRRLEPLGWLATTPGRRIAND